MTRDFYENNMYGKWRTDETVSYEMLGPGDSSKCKGSFFPTEFDDAEKIRIDVSVGSRKASFFINLFLPESGDRFLPNGKCPVIVCMHPIFGKEFALKKGYALVFLNPTQIASDDIRHEGAFYELYPYESSPESQTGVLMAWAWGASKVLDAFESGLAADVAIDEKGAVVTGVSRYGKATAVCGAFENRFRMVAPACSGAGGLALYSIISEGSVFDFTKIGGPADYTYSKNEPLSCLQSDAERGWFNERFLEYKAPEEIPYDQENLVLLSMNKDNFYFVIGACMSEDWVNAPAMWECYKRALHAYDEKGLHDNLVCHFHKEGHAVLEEDLALMIPYFNKMYYKLDEEVDFNALHTSVFA